MPAVYEKQELVSATRVAKEFSRWLRELRTGPRRRVVVLKNNAVEAVLLPVDEYEALVEASQIAEHEEIYGIVQARKKSESKPGKPLGQVLRAHGIKG